MYICSIIGTKAWYKSLSKVGSNCPKYPNETLNKIKRVSSNPESVDVLKLIYFRKFLASQATIISERTMFRV